MRILQDGDILVYRIGHAAQNRNYGVEVQGELLDIFPLKSQASAMAKGIPESTVKQIVTPAPFEDAVMMMRRQLIGIVEALNSPRMTIYLSGANNFRDSIATIKPYKGHRDRTEDRPYWYHKLFEYLIEDWDAILVEGMEADDALGIAQMQHTDTDSVISTIDKDLNMIPGWHYNFVKQDMYLVDEIDALRNFYIQMLMGDASDNILGIPDIGIVTASECLAYTTTEIEMYKAVRHMYKTNYAKFGKYTDLPVDDIIMEHARLLWIKRKENDEWAPPVDEDHNNTKELNTNPNSS